MKKKCFFFFDSKTVTVIFWLDRISRSGRKFTPNKLPRMDKSSITKCFMVNNVVMREKKIKPVSIVYLVGTKYLRDGKINQYKLNLSRLMLVKRSRLFSLPQCILNEECPQIFFPVYLFDLSHTLIWRYEGGINWINS